MKYWSLLLWVTQFGISAIFPTCAFLLLGSWLQNSYGLGQWIMILMGIMGVLTSISSVSACIRSLRKDAEKAGNEKEAPVAFNKHE